MEKETETKQTDFHFEKDDSFSEEKKRQENLKLSINRLLL